MRVFMRLATSSRTLSSSSSVVAASERFTGVTRAPRSAVLTRSRICSPFPLPTVSSPPRPLISRASEFSTTPRRLITGWPWSEISAVWMARVSGETQISSACHRALVSTALLRRSSSERAEYSSSAWRSSWWSWVTLSPAGLQCCPPRRFAWRGLSSPSPAAPSLCVLWSLRRSSRCTVVDEAPSDKRSETTPGGGESSPPAVRSGLGRNRAGRSRRSDMPSSSSRSSPSPPRELPGQVGDSSGADSISQRSSSTRRQNLLAWRHPAAESGWSTPLTILVYLWFRWASFHLLSAWRSRKTCFTHSGGRWSLTKTVQAPPPPWPEPFAGATRSLGSMSTAQG
mmetsp:Transcript_32724/g.94724  ORF Transcript_32724/g.94724 Transcript_32724/m.94724 type:complete len:341 (-) Transcript_32724:441-1463(-)